MIKLGNQIDDGVCIGQVGSKPFPPNWPRLRDAMQYYLDNYDFFGPSGITLVDQSSMNLPFIPGVSIDISQFTGQEYGALQVLIHEPLHDIGQYGLGHGEIKEIVGPTGKPTDPNGSDYDQFIDYLRDTRVSGETLWNRLHKGLTRP